MDISEHFPKRGDTKKLQKIAWWGSVLGDIACAATRATDSRILQEAALFNLAIVLFDSAVDDSKDGISELIRALEPARLNQRLKNPTERQFMLTSEVPGRQLIVQLFDSVLSSVGKRLSGNNPHIQHLSELLTTMYESELGLSPSSFEAKRLPVVFIGALVDYNKNKRLSELFEALARFLYLWDDWLDLEEDMYRMAPNAFLGPCTSVYVLNRFLYVLTALVRLLGGPLFHMHIAETLAAPLRNAIDAARQINKPTYIKTITLCRHLIN